MGEANAGKRILLSSGRLKLEASVTPTNWVEIAVLIIVVVLAVRFLKKRTAKTTTIISTAISTQFVGVTLASSFNRPDDKRIRFPALASPISPVEILRSSYGRLGSLPSSQ